MHNAFVHFTETASISTPESLNIFTIDKKNIKSGELVVVPKPLLFGCRHYFDSTKELPPEPIEKSFSKTTIGGATFFEITAENGGLPSGLHNPEANYVTVPSSIIIPSLFVSFINSQPTDRLLIGEFHSADYESMFYNKQIPENAERDLKTL